MAVIGRPSPPSKLNASDIASNAITSAHIQIDALTHGDLAPNSITASELADNAVDTAAIAADAVDGTKIVDNAINSEHYTDGSIDTAHIADDQVTGAKLANDIAITTTGAIAGATLTMTGNITMADDTSIGISDSAERIEFDGAGDISVLGANLGVGIDAPASLLHCKGSNPDLYLDRTATSQRAGISFTTNGAETNGAWAIRMNNSGTSATPSLSFHKFTGTDAQVMTLTDAGNVGIGVVAPQQNLHVNDSTSSSEDMGTLFLSNYDTSYSDTTGHGAIYFGGTRNNTHWGVGAMITAEAAEAWDADNEYGTDMFFRTAAIGASSTSVRMSILSDGNVGIGTPGPESKLHIQGANCKLTIRSSATDPAYVQFLPDDAAAASQWLIEAHKDSPYKLTFYRTNSSAAVLTMQGTNGDILPGADNSQDFGSGSLRWKNIYSADLQLSNEGTGGNEVDGTEGNWTIQEGDENLFVLNRKTGKKFKMNLTEI